MYKNRRVVHRQAGSASLRPSFIPFVRETLGCFHCTGTLRCQTEMLRHDLSVHTDLFQELSWTLWWFTGSILEGLSFPQSWSAAGLYCYLLRSWALILFHSLVVSLAHRPLRIHKWSNSVPSSDESLALLTSWIRRMSDMMYGACCI